MRRPVLRYVSKKSAHKGEHAAAASCRNCPHQASTAGAQLITQYIRRVARNTAHRVITRTKRACNNIPRDGGSNTACARKTGFFFTGPPTLALTVVVVRTDFDLTFTRTYLFAGRASSNSCRRHCMQRNRAVVMATGGEYTPRKVIRNLKLSSMRFSCMPTARSSSLVHCS